MSRFFNANTDRIQNTSVTGAAATGTIAIWHKPGWNAGDSKTHVFWQFGSTANTDSPSFQKFKDNNIYAGFNGGGHGDQRILIADTGLFTSGTWAHWVFTWSNAAGQTLYKNAVSKGTHALTAFSDTQVDVGNYNNANVPPADYAGNDTLADFAYWTVILTAGEISALLSGIRPPTVRAVSLSLYWPLDGLQTTEPDLSGLAQNGTVAGTAKANGPPITYFTPRWPSNVEPSAAASFVPAWARGSNLPVLGTGNY